MNEEFSALVNELIENLMKGKHLFEKFPIITMLNRFQCF